jgi:hypothetical protein
MREAARRALAGLLAAACLPVAACAVAVSGTARPVAAPASASPTASATRSVTPASSAQPASGRPSAPKSYPASTPPPERGTRCPTDVLRGTLELADAAAGNRYARLVVTNTGTAPCTLRGHHGFQLLGPGDAMLPTDVHWTDNPGTALVTLAPGASAASNLRWSAVAAAGDATSGPCQPEPVRAQAIPPDETTPVVVDWTFGPVCAGGHLEISAFYPK